jgi:hypothetical protein
MTTTYTPNHRKKPAWLVDIDGTMTLGPHQRGPFEWDKVGNDQPNGPVMRLVRALYYDGYEIVFVSGRSEECRGRTENWLWQYFLHRKFEIFMRSAGDYRKDAIIKQEIFDAHIRDNYWVQGVLDDRQQVVDMWREMGLTCLQVAPGDF